MFMNRTPIFFLLLFAFAFALHIAACTFEPNAPLQFAILCLQPLHSLLPLAFALVAPAFKNLIPGGYMLRSVHILHITFLALFCIGMFCALGT